MFFYLSRYTNWYRGKNPDFEDGDDEDWDYKYDTPFTKVCVNYKSAEWDSGANDPRLFLCEG